jgi:DMSO/TMAO reductase YedYZ molybdopterin-dependent catalytic subunit
MQRILIKLIGASLLLVSTMLAAAPDNAVVQLIVPGKPAAVIDNAAMTKWPRTTTMAGAHDDAPTLWEGVTLVDILGQAGVPMGKQLRGRALATFVRVTATDGYQVVFSLGELDLGLGHQQAILVDSHGGQPLTEDGPFRLLVPGDTRPARWVRNVRSIEVVDGGTGSGKAAH